MKKLMVSIFCCILALGVTGCGSKETNLLNNPKDSDVEKVIKKIEGTKSTCVVTEDNDPNGNLNKEGWYTGAVYFRLTQVDEKVAKQEYMPPVSDDACAASTAGGGQIEIYANEDDAKKRDDYLANFDGSVLGEYHKVRGSVIIRLSNDLSASQQNDIEEKIYTLLNETAPTE